MLKPRSLLLLRCASGCAALLCATLVWSATNESPRAGTPTPQGTGYEQAAGRDSEARATAQALAQACAETALEAAQAPRSCTELIDLARRQQLPAPMLAAAHGNRAVWLARQATRAEEFEQALTESAQALALAPDRAALRINHATVLLASGRIEDALATYEGLLNQQQGPQNEQLPVFEHLVRFNYAIALRASGAAEQADLELQMANEAERKQLPQPANPPLHSGAGLEPRLQ